MGVTTETLNRAFQIEDEQKNELRFVRTYNFDQAWKLATIGFTHLEAEAMTIATSRVTKPRTCELTTATPWVALPGKLDGKYEMRAVRVQKQELPSFLGKIILRGKKPAPPETVAFALDHRPIGYEKVVHRYAEMMLGHQYSNRIVFPSTALVAGSREERYDHWEHVDLSVIEDFENIFRYLHERTAD